MSKGHTRRPSAVDRKEWEAAYEAIFACGKLPDPYPDPADWQFVESVDIPLKAVEAREQRQMDPCDIADTMTPWFDDQRGRA